MLTLFRHGLGDDEVQPRWQRGEYGARPGRWLAQVGFERESAVVRGVRDGAGEQLVQDAAQRVDVHAVIQPLEPDLFRRGVVRGEQQIADAGQLDGLVDRLGDPEVHQQDLLQVLGMTAGSEQDVGRFDIAVQQPAGMRIVQRDADLAYDVHGSFRGQRPVLEHLAAVGSGDVLHVDPELVIRASAVVHSHDVPVVQLRREIRLTLEPNLETGVTGQVGAHELECIPARQPGMPGQVDRAHSTGPQDPVDGESGKERAGRVGHGCPSR